MCTHTFVAFCGKIYSLLFIVPPPAPSSFRWLLVLAGFLHDLHAFWDVRYESRFVGGARVASPLFWGDCNSIVLRWGLTAWCSNPLRLPRLESTRKCTVKYTCRLQGWDVVYIIVCECRCHCNCTFIHIYTTWAESIEWDLCFCTGIFICIDMQKYVYIACLHIATVFRFLCMFVSSKSWWNGFIALTHIVVMLYRPFCFFQKSAVMICLPRSSRLRLATFSGVTPKASL